MTRCLTSFLLLVAAIVLPAAAQNESAKQPTRKTVAGNQPALVAAAADGRLHLLAGNCEIYGNQIAVYEPQRCIGWWTSREDYVVWEVEVPRAGLYEVWLEWAITDEWANNRFSIESGPHKLEGSIPTTGGFDKYRHEKFGTLELAAGRQRMAMRPAGPVNGELADLREVTLVPVEKAAADARCYEMRTYYASPGKLPALHERFRQHTLKLFAKHGMENIGYWVPVENPENKLIFLLAYPGREAREASWKAFLADPEWKSAQQQSEAGGRLVERVEQVFPKTTDYSARGKGDVSKGGVFELRTYTTPAGLLPNLDARFRDHTMKLFARHGMNHWLYFHKTPDQPAADTTLIYFLTHASREAAQKSFAAFRQDPDWIAAREASEQRAGGSLTVKEGGVKSEFLLPTDYSPVR